MKNKVKKNLLLIGLLLGVILFCALRDCTFMEGFREGVTNRDDDDDDDVDTKEYKEQKKKEKENPGFLANLEGAAKGVAKGAGTLVRKTKEVVRTAKSASNNETLEETIEKEKKAKKK
jgi:hypothetical protein